MIFSNQLCSLGFPHVLTTPAKLQERFVEELLDAAAQASKVVTNELKAAGITIEPPCPVAAEPPCHELDDEAEAVQGEIIAGCEEPLDEGGRRPLSDLTWLVEGFVRSSEPRGGEVRLDLALPLFPKAAHRVSVGARRWTWRHVVSSRMKRDQVGRHHINALELKAVLLALNWRLRSKQRCRRFVHLVDSQVSLAILCKGRSSSRRLLPQARRIGARQLAGFLFPTFAYVKSAWNPADEPSRPG